jgi:hypothetical protein
MKKLIFTLLTSSILFTIGCEDEDSVEADAIIGTWTFSAICTFADENCSGECTDMTEEWIEGEHSHSMTFLEGGTGTFTYGENSDSFNWSGSGPYTLTAEDEEPLTVTLSDGSITWTGVDDVCFQFTLIK